MSSRRLARLNEQLKREISDILRDEVRDPRIGVPTVTGVEVTPDLWLARVYVRSDPTTEKRGVSDLLEGLEHAGPFIRRQLAEVLEVRRIPELRFMADKTLDQAIRIEKILQEVLPERGSDEDASAEAGPAESPDADGPEGRDGSVEG